MAPSTGLEALTVLTDSVLAGDSSLACITGVEYNGDAAGSAVKVERLHQWHWRSGLGECAQVSGQTGVV